jgi:hypothetical protein
LQASRGAKVEVARVFVSQDAVFDLSSLPPVGCTLEILLAEVGFCEGAKVVLQLGEVAVFLKSIKKRDDRTTV